MASREVPVGRCAEKDTSGQVTGGSTRRFAGKDQAGTMAVGRPAQVLGEGVRRQRQRGRPSQCSVRATWQRCHPWRCGRHSPHHQQLRSCCGCLGKRAKGSAHGVALTTADLGAPWLWINVGLRPGAILGWSALGQVHGHRARVLDTHVLSLPTCLLRAPGALGPWLWAVGTVML